MIPNLQRQKLSLREAYPASRAWSQDSRPGATLWMFCPTVLLSSSLATRMNHYGLSTSSHGPAGEVSPAQLSISLWLSETNPQKYYCMNLLSRSPSPWICCTPPHPTRGALRCHSTWQNGVQNLSWALAPESWRGRVKTKQWPKAN